MKLFKYIRDCFTEAPIDDSLCGLNSLTIKNEEENIEDNYLKQYLSEEEYAKSDLKREIFSDTYNQEREEYIKLRRKDTIAYSMKHLQK